MDPMQPKTGGTKRSAGACDGEPQAKKADPPVTQYTETVTDIYSPVPARLTTVDRIDLDRAKYILNMPNSRIEKLFYPEKPDWHPGKLTVSARKEHIKMMRQWLSKVCEGGGQLRHGYRFAVTRTNGRRYIQASFGAQSLAEAARAFLLGHQCKDLDMSNCHFRITLQSCKDYKYPGSTEKLEYYINNRESVLEHMMGDMPRKRAKQTLIRMLNTDLMDEKLTKGSGNFWTANSWVKKFFEEKKQIMDWFLENCDLCPKTTRNISNPKSSRFDQFLNVVEDNLLMQMAQRLATEGLIESTEHILPLFDGFQYYGDDETQAAIEKYLAEGRCCTDSWWVHKPIEVEVTMDTTDQEVEALDYHSIKTKFEETNFEISSPYSFGETVLDKNGNPEDSFCRSEKERMLSLRHLKFRNEKGLMEYFFPKWVEDASRRRYRCMDFYPHSAATGCPTMDPGVYNMFRGYQANKVDLPGGYRPQWFLDLVEKGLANGDEETGKYILRYVAKSILYPANPHRFCLVMRGEEGVGKDTLVKVQTAIMGQKLAFRGVEINDVFPKDGGFNESIKNKLILQLDECTAEQFNKHQAQIYHGITTEQHVLKEKYKATITVDNYANTVITSNKVNPATLKKNQRRFWVCKAGDWHKGDKDYWNWFYATVGDRDEINRLYSWLLENDYGVDLPTWDASANAPRNEETKTAEDNSTPVYIEWLRETISNDLRSLHWLKRPNHDQQYLMPVSQVYRHFKDWCRNEGWCQDFQGMRWLQTHLRDVPGILWGKPYKIDGKATRVVVLDKAQVEGFLSTKYPLEDSEMEEVRTCVVHSARSVLPSPFVAAA